MFVNKNSLKNFDILLIDSISKFNIFKKNNLINVEKLKIFVNIKLSEGNFLRHVLSLSSIFLYVFNRKIQVIKIINELSKKNSKSRNSLIFSIGLTIRKNLIFKNLDYLLNIIKFCSKKTDDSFFFKKKDLAFLYYFNNCNYFIGLDTTKLLKWNLDFNFLLVFSHKYSKHKFSKKIINFYEKTFL